MFRTILTCEGLTESEGVIAPADIEEEFTHRPWHANVRCMWNGHQLRLTLENDFDATGQASLDEFSDAIHACINYSGEISLNIESVESKDA
jgi:hypothetical protein